MPRVILKGYIQVNDNDLEIVKKELPKHIQLTLAESGCLIFEVTPDPNNKNIFQVYEEFIDRDAFEAHQLRIKTSQWGEISSNVQRHYQIIEED